MTPAGHKCCITRRYITACLRNIKLISVKRRQNVVASGRARRASAMMCWKLFKWEISAYVARRNESAAFLFVARSVRARCRPSCRRSTLAVDLPDVNQRDVAAEMLGVGDMCTAVLALIEKSVTVSWRVVWLRARRRGAVSSSK